MAFTGTNSLVQVGISMTLEDHFTRESGKLSQSFRSMMGEINNWNRGINMSVGYAFDAGRQTIGGMYKAYKYSADVSKDIFLAAKMSHASAREQANMMQTAKDLNAQTPLTASDIASGERFMAMAGNSAKNIQSMIKPAAQLSSIFGMQLGGKGGVADLMTNIGATFNIPQTTASYQHLADVLGIATTSANMSLADLANSFKYSGAEFRNAKVPIEDAAAAIGVLGDQGIQASSAGTALANMYRYLTLSITGQRKKGFDALKSIGIDPKSLLDANGNLLSIDKIVQTIYKHLGPNASTTTLTSFMYNAMGVRGTRAASALIADMATRNKFAKIKSNYNQYPDWTNKTMDEFINTPAGQVAQFNASIENLVVTLGQQLAMVFNPLLKGLTWVSSMVNKISESGFGGWAIRVGAMAIIIQTIGQGFRLMYMTVRMINMQYQLMTAHQGRGLAEATATNTVFASMEQHLREMVALQMQLTGMQLAPGQTIKGANGAANMQKLKNGTIVYRNSAGQFMSAGSYASIMAGTVGTVTVASAGRATAAASRGIVGAVGGLGSRLLSFLGGPWGIGISIALPLIIEGINKLVNQNDEASKKEDERLERSYQSNKHNMDNLSRVIRESVTAGVAIGGSKIDFSKAFPIRPWSTRGYNYYSGNFGTKNGTIALSGSSLTGDDTYNRDY